MKHLVRCLLVVIAASLALTSCKAWRTVTTTATYTELQDSSRVTTTIQTKTQEEYTGVRKNR